MIYVNFDKYGVLNHIEYNDEVIFKGNNNVNKVFVCFDDFELKPQHYLTYSALINDKDYSGNLTDLASVRTTYNGKDGYMFSIFSNLTKEAGTLKLSVRLVDRLTENILVSGILPLIVQDSAVSTYSNVNITTTQYQALLTAFDDLAQTFNETNFKTINEESLFGEGNITLPTIEYVDALNNDLREYVDDKITNLGYIDEELRNQIAEQNEIIEKQDRRIKVLELASEGNILLTTTEEDIAYEINATSNILPFAEINKIGGMTYKSDNLLSFNDVAETTTNGITYSVINGEIKVSGTATSNGTFFIPINQYTMSGNHNVKLFKNGTFGTTNHYFSLRTTDNQTLTTINLVSQDSATYTSSTSVILNRMGISYVNGQTYNFIIKPMLVLGSTAPTTYQPYFEGLRDTKITSITSKGANLLDSNLLSAKDGTFTKQKDGTYISKALGSYGTAYFNSTWNASLSSMVSLNGFKLQKGTYYISLKAKLNSGVSSSGVGVAINLLNSTQLSTTAVLNPTLTNNYQEYKRTFTLSTDDEIGINIQVGSNASNAVIQVKDFMIAKADTSYKPYKEIVSTKAIPQEIQNIDGYGQSNPNNSNEYNYIDFENKKFIAFGKIENGEWVSYETPIETDLSYRITDDFIIEIEGNGTIIFDNEYKQDIPYNWTYQEKL